MHALRAAAADANSKHTPTPPQADSIFDETSNNSSHKDTPAKQAGSAAARTQLFPIAVLACNMYAMP
jgi:hypothetical protein